MKISWFHKIFHYIECFGKQKFVKQRFDCIQIFYSMHMNILNKLIVNIIRENVLLNLFKLYEQEMYYIDNFLKFGYTHFFCIVLSCVDSSFLVRYFLFIKKYFKMKNKPAFIFILQRKFGYYNKTVANLLIIFFQKIKLYTIFKKGILLYFKFFINSI